MARIKGGLNAKKRHNRVLKLAKGYIFPKLFQEISTDIHKELQKKEGRAPCPIKRKHRPNEAVFSVCACVLS